MHHEIGVAYAGDCVSDALACLCAWRCTRLQASSPSLARSCALPLPSSPLSSLPTSLPSSLSSPLPSPPPLAHSLAHSLTRYPMRVLVRWGADGSHETRTCTFVGYGQPNGPTCMATTVGLTAAAGAHLLLTGQVATPGIVTPTIPEVYEPVLQLLRAEGIKFEESVHPGLGLSAEGGATAAALCLGRSPASQFKPPVEIHN